MHLDKKIVNNNLVVRLHGDFDLIIADRFRDEVEKVLETTPIENIIINLENVGFIDSSGLGVILGRYKHMMKRGGKVILINPRPQVTKILELSGILKIIEVLSTEEEAI